MIVGAVALVASGVGALAGAAAVGTFLGASAATAAAAGAAALSTLSTIGLVASLTATAATMAIGPPGVSVEGSPEKFKLDPQASIPIIFGRTIAGGYIVHRVAYGPELNDVENPWQVFAVVWSGCGPVNAIEKFLVDKVEVTFDGSGNVTTADYLKDSSPFMWLKTQLGECPESAALALPSPVNSIPGWGSDYKLSGYAAGLWGLRFDKKAKMYTAGVPLGQAVIQGILVYDPRLDSTYPGGSGSCRPLDESTYVYSENPWLHALTFALGRWQNGKRVAGVGMPAAAIDIAAFVEAANVADANEWTCGGTVSSADDKWSVLKMLAQAGGGEPIRLGAKLSCLVDTPRVSLATITSRDPVGKVTVVATQARRDRINGVIARITSEEHGWEVVPLDVVRPSTYLAEDGDERTREVDYQLVQDKDQAAELATYEVCNSREFGPITIPLKPVWMGYKPGDCLTLDIDEAGLESQTAIIINRSLDPSSGMATLAFKTETDAKHAFALGETGVAPPTPSLTPPNINDVSAPSSGDWTATGGVVESDSGAVPAILIIGQASVTTIDSIVFEYRKDGETDADWKMAGTEAPTTTLKEIIGLPPTQAYEVAVSYIVRGVQGARLVLGPVTTGEWSTIAGLTAVLTNPSVTLPADFFGNIIDYSAASGEWDIRAGNTEVTDEFTIGTKSGGNPDGLSVTYVGGAYAVTGGFDGLADFSNLTMQAVGSGAYSAVTIERTFRLSKVRDTTAVDTDPPATPAGLALSSSLQTDTDGTQKARLIATWSANTDDDLAGYRLLLRQAGGNFVEYPVSGTRYEVAAVAGITYEARLQAIDVSGNVSNTYPTPPAVISYTVGGDSAAPGLPYNLFGSGGVRSNLIQWVNPSDSDFSYVEVYVNTVNNSGTSTRTTTVAGIPNNQSFFIDENINQSTPKFYWLKSVDTSGNRSAFTAVINATPGYVISGDVAVGSLLGDRITAATLNANRLYVAGNSTLDALATGITVGVGGTTIGNVNIRSADPLSYANTLTTKIVPGLVLISGGTTLANWRNGSDNTKIEGGSIAANTIAANSIKVGARGLDMAGLEFQANWNGAAGVPSTNGIWWTAGTISYINDAGTATTVNIPADGTAWTSGTLYVYWVKGNAFLNASTNIATAYAPENVVMATYRGGTSLVVTNGGTIIDGSKITTDTVLANKFVAGTISSRELATTTLISVSSQLGNAVVSTLKIAGATIFAPVPFAFGDVLLPSSGVEQVIGTTGSVTIGDSVYGSALVTVQGQYDGTIDDDSGQAIHLEIRLNGTGSYTRYATTRAGSKVTSGAAYAYQSVCQTYSVAGVGYASIEARIVCGAIGMPGRSTQRSYFREGKITIAPGKR